MKWSLDKLEGIFCCPSYKRAGSVDTLKTFPSCRVYVSSDEYSAYVKANPGADIKWLPNSVQGNIARVRNWILDQNKGKAVCIVDDDLQYIGYWEGDEDRRITDERMLTVFLQKYTRMAQELDTPLWGVNLNIDKQCYREYTPFSFTSVVLAPFMVHLNPMCRFDENIPLKEDYDFCLQTFNRHRKVLRVNKFHYLTKQGVSATGRGQTGGCAAMRSVQEEMRQLELLRKKWGDQIVQVDSLGNSRSHSSEKEKRYDINPVIRVPIMGV